MALYLWKGIFADFEKDILGAERMGVMRCTQTSLLIVVFQIIRPCHMPRSNYLLLAPVREDGSDPSHI